MYIIIGIIVLFLVIITIVYYKDKNRILKELKKIEKENGTNSIKNSKK